MTEPARQWGRDPSVHTVTNPGMSLVLEDQPRDRHIRNELVSITLP